MANVLLNPATSFFQRAVALVLLMVCLAGLLLATIALKQSLFNHELQGYMHYWGNQGSRAQVPSERLTNHLEQRLVHVEDTAANIRPANPQTWLHIGQVHHWLAYFATQQQNQSKADDHLNQAQFYYAQQTQQVPNWPHGVLLQLEIEQQRDVVSVDFDRLWQAAFNHSQQHSQIQYALAKQVPELWTRLNTQQKQQALQVFYQASNQSVHQARVLYRIEPKQAWLLSTTCLMLNKPYKKELCK